MKNRTARFLRPTDARAFVALVLAHGGTVSAPTHSLGQALQGFTPRAEIIVGWSLGTDAESAPQ